MNDPKRDRMMSEREIDAAVDAAYDPEPVYGRGPSFASVLARHELDYDDAARRYEQDQGLWDDEIDSPYSDYPEDTW